MKRSLTIIAFVVWFFACSKHDSVTPAGTSGTSGTSLVLAVSSFSPLSSPVDSPVTIMGANFSPNMANDIVRFNDTLATVKYATDSELIVIVPAGASTGKITVMVGNQTATGAGNFIVSDQWTLLKNGYSGSQMVYAVSFTIGTKLYIGAGEGSGPGYLGTWLKEFWQYDAVADGWTRKADYPGTPTGFGVGFSIGGNGYVVNNPDSAGNNLLWQYDTATDSWARKANFPGDPGFWQGLMAFGVNGYGYVGLGGFDNLSNQVFWQYDPVADTWAQKNNFPGRATTFTAYFVIGDFAYVGTGTVGISTDSASAEFYQYNPATDAWIQKRDFPGGPRNSAAGFSIGNNGYLGTGYDLNGHYLGDFWQYNPSTDSWIQKKNFGGGVRAQAAGFSASSQGYLGFGFGSAYPAQPEENSGNYFDLWEYQP